MPRIALIDLLKTRYPARNPKELYGEILRGGVIVHGEKILKPGAPVSPEADIVLRPRSLYVSRGGEKLAAALDAWQVPCAGTTWIDAGCSTGGFTDCLLQLGASLVYAVDVGVGQLDWRLRGDPRVKVREGTNVMEMRREDFSPVPARAAVDLSFRSLRRAAAHILSLTGEGWGIFLVKPQFEYRDAPADFHGVVRDPLARREILRELAGDLAADGVTIARGMRSPVAGRKGNREFLCLLRAGTAADSPEPPEELFLEG